MQVYKDHENLFSPPHRGREQRVSGPLLQDGIQGDSTSRGIAKFSILSFILQIVPETLAPRVS